MPPGSVSPGTVAGDTATVERVVRDATGSGPDELRFLNTDEGLVALYSSPLARARMIPRVSSKAKSIERSPRRAISAAY